MQLTIISDTHMDYCLLPIDLEGEILIHCGDIDTYDQFNLWQFNKWLGKQNFKHKIVIGGNHDKYICESGYKLTQNTLTNAIYLENSGIEIGGVYFYGSPITPTFLDWYFMCDRNEISKYWDLIPLKTNILITHGPPFGILDWSIFSKQHVGCESLLKRVEFVKPKVHCFGHIHHSYGIYKSEHTTFVNASLMSEGYALVNKPITVTI